jgi:hypothetical protein
MDHSSQRVTVKVKKQTLVKFFPFGHESQREPCDHALKRAQPDKVRNKGPLLDTGRSHIGQNDPTFALQTPFG